MSLDYALNLRQLGVKLIVLLLMRQPCARGCRSLLPVGDLNLKHSRYKHINLAGMDTDKQSCGLFPHVLVSDVKWGQFLR